MAGPAAESPSTISSSASGPWVRQSASLSGMAPDDSVAALRRRSRLALVETRVSTAWATFSRTAATWVLRPPPSIQLVKPSRTTSYTIDCTGGRAQLLLGLALELRLGEA